MSPLALRTPPFALVAGLAIGGLYLGTLYCCRQTVVADGYDGVGLVLALTDFDLRRFQPQPPGFPLLVIAGRLLVRLGLPPGLALATVSALLLAAGLGAVCGLIDAWRGRLAALLFLLLGPTAPLPFGLAVATLSDGAGLGVLLLGLLFARSQVAAQAPPLRQVAVGGLLGFGLGVRPQQLPLLLLGLAAIYGSALAQRRLDRRAGLALGVGLVLGVLLWLLPLLYVVGPQTLFSLTVSQASGHLREFGGGALIDAAPWRRPARLLTGIVDGGLGPLGGLWLLPLGWLALRRWSAPERSLQLLLIVAAAYALWLLVLLPVGGSGRHLLPLALLAPLLVSCGLATLPLPGWRRFVLLGLALIVGLGSGRAVWAARRSLSPGAALATAVVERHAPRRLYGTRAARYLDLYYGSGSARPAAYLGEVIADLERQDNLPAEVLLTSEVLAAAGSQAQLRRLARYCYADAVPLLLRWDRTAAGDGNCVDLVSYRVRR